ncbi:hypothetical protein ACWGJB_36335 [Streptomyces sp. NPDC054813]
MEIAELPVDPGDHDGDRDHALIVGARHPGGPDSKQLLSLGLL